MLAVKYNRFGHTSVESTSDYQSVFDIVYNATGNHELAMQSYAVATKLSWGESKQVTVDADTVTVICYNETTSDVNAQGRIVQRHRVVTVPDAVRALRIGQSSNCEVRVVLYKDDVWTLIAMHKPNVGIKFIASYSYKRGTSGEIEIQIINGRPVYNNRGITIIKPVLEKVIKVCREFNSGRRV